MGSRRAAARLQNGHQELGSTAPAGMQTFSASGNESAVHSSCGAEHQIGRGHGGDSAGWDLKTERVLSTAQSVTVGIAGGSDSVLNFCSNNYLGLSNHPEVVEAGVAALRSHGAGVSSVRFICGTQNIHKQLEEKIARFHEREASILYPSCFDANAGLFEQICGPEDVILSDELNHASIIDGIRLTKSRKYRYKHKDMADLEKGLQESQDGRSRLIVTDGVFSMDGNVCPLPQIKELADRYGASIFFDECHATGFFGKTGRGTEEFFGMP